MSFLDEISAAEEKLKQTFNDIVKDVEDPKKFWEDSCEAAIDNFERMVNSTTNGIISSLSRMSHGIMASHGWMQKEISLFHELETHIRKETLTSEVWKDISERLDALRNEIRDAALTEVANAKAMFLKQQAAQQISQNTGVQSSS